MDQTGKQLTIAEVKWERDGHRSPLLEEILRLLLQRPLTNLGEPARVLAEEGSTVEEGGDA